MHGDPVGRAVEGRQQGHHFNAGIVLKPMKRPGAILSAAPG
jgi:hypothetical protein